MVSGVTALRYLNVPMYRCGCLPDAASCLHFSCKSVLLEQQLCTCFLTSLLLRCSVIRRSTTLLVVSGEFWLFNNRPSRRSLAALLLMVGGAVVAGVTDLTFNLPG